MPDLFLHSPLCPKCLEPAIFIIEKVEARVAISQTLDACTFDYTGANVVDWYTSKIAARKRQAQLHCQNDHTWLSDFKGTEEGEKS